MDTDKLSGSLECMTTPQIPEDAKVAAGGAVYDVLFHHDGLNGTECDRVAEAALEAGARALVAQALRDLAARAEHDSPDDGVSPHWIRARADELEAHE